MIEPRALGPAKPAGAAKVLSSTRPDRVVCRARLPLAVRAYAVLSWPPRPIVLPWSGHLVWLGDAQATTRLVLRGHARFEPGIALVLPA